MSAIKLTRFLAHQARMVIQKNKFFVAAGWKSAAVPGHSIQKNKFFVAAGWKSAAVPGHSLVAASLTQSCLFYFSCLVDSRTPVSVEPARRFGQPRLPNPQSGSVLALNTEHLNLNTSVGRYPWPTLRRRYGPVLPTVASSLTDFHVRRSDAIRAPGLAWAATSMIAAGYQSISSCQSQS